MRREIPEDIHVRLKQPEVESDRVVVINLSQIAGVDDVPQFSNRAGIDKGVIDHQHSSQLLRQTNQLSGVGDSGGHRFLNQDMFALSETGFGQLKVS